MQSLLRAAARALADFAAKAHEWADEWDGPASPPPAPDPAPDPDPGLAYDGVDLVGIDLSTSIQAVAAHVIDGWDRYRAQAAALRPRHRVWAFGVNARPFPLTRRPVRPWRLPRLGPEYFKLRGYGRGLVENGSAFYDYIFAALGHAQALGVFDGERSAVPLTISLLCDGWPNGGVYGAADVRPLLEAARARGVRFKVVGFAPFQQWATMWQFGAALGLTCAEMEVAGYTGSTPDAHSIHTGFESLSSF